jgi:hypothetical protein
VLTAATAKKVPSSRPKKERLCNCPISIVATLHLTLEKLGIENEEVHGFRRLRVPHFELKVGSEGKYTYGSERSPKSAEDFYYS